MERLCEFCKATTAVVYCIADAANLCLSCDAKVHSANALSTRHLRTLLCDCCKHQPCVVQCLDHKMFVCNGCNDKLHGVSSEHHRQDVSCYTGCPSTNDFAVMWGFQVMDSASLEHSFSVGIPEMLAPFGERDVQRDAVNISEQILELERLQIRQEIGGLGSKEEADPFPLDGNTCESLIDLPQTGKELMEEISAFPFSQMEQLSSSSILGDLSFWECRSPYKNNQLWHQNLLDIGVCEDTVFHDDFHTPDVDLNFRNFDEVFGSDQEAIADKNIFCISPHEMRASSSSSFNKSFFSPQSVSSTLSLSEQVISCYAPLSTNARQKAISRLKEKKRARAEEKKA